MNQCRVCHQRFFEKPLFRFENMPKSAQYFPDANSIANDCGVEVEVCQCSGCGLIQLSNDPVYYYREVIRGSAISEEMKAFRTKQFQEFVKRFALQGKRVLEVGCGCGEYLSIMKQCAVKPFGLEYRDESVSQCCQNGLNVTKGFFGNATHKLANSPFDAFYILNFLEHLPDPNSVLRGIYQNLAEEGIGLVEVPNFDMNLQKHIFSEFVTDHLLYFTKETLSRLLSINGFDLIECTEVWHEYSISATVRKRKILDVSDFAQFQAQLKREINDYLNHFEANQVAIWGASHQALMLIAMSNLSEKIKYVVDSAPFKQGKYTPVSHLPIVSPEKLDLDPVEAVIVMAAGYSNEVAGIIWKKFSERMQIAILRDNCLEIW